MASLMDKISSLVGQLALICENVLDWLGPAVPVEEGQAAAPDAGPAVPPHRDSQAVLAPATTARALPRVHILRQIFLNYLIKLN